MRGWKGWKGEQINIRGYWIECRQCWPSPDHHRQKIPCPFAATVTTVTTVTATIQSIFSLIRCPLINTVRVIGRIGGAGKQTGTGAAAAVGNIWWTNTAKKLGKRERESSSIKRRRERGKKRPRQTGKSSWHIGSRTPRSIRYLERINCLIDSFSGRAPIFILFPLPLPHDQNWHCQRKETKRKTSVSQSVAVRPITVKLGDCECAVPSFSSFHWSDPPGARAPMWIEGLWVQPINFSFPLTSVEPMPYRWSKNFIFFLKSVIITYR